MEIHADAFIQTQFGGTSITEYHGQLAIELLDSVPSSTVHVSQSSTSPLTQLVCEQVLAYLQNPKFIFTLSMPQHGTAFQQRVWQVIAQIPCGQTRTYRDIAIQIGSGPRAVANACGANKLPLLIPCHRVVAKNGIGGFMQGRKNGLLIKLWLLQHEGVRLNGVARE